MSSIILQYQGLSRVLLCPENAPVLDLLRIDPWVRAQQIPLETPCGGSGRCGKCRIFVTINGETSLRNLCQLKTVNGMILSFPDKDASSFQGGKIETDFVTLSSASVSSYRQGIGCAVDIGTTTIALKAYDLSTMETIGTASDWNHQTAYGSDVISRIRYVMDHEDGLAVLSSCVREQIRSLILKALHADQLPEDLEMVVAGNTVMEHLFAGIDPTSIGQAPYLPSTYFEEDTLLTLPEFSSARIRMVPCISGFIGGDITAGLLSSSLLDPALKETTLFMDIGTNGELALFHEGTLLTCSTACGPAFEGAEISCGMRGVPGAVDHMTMDHGDVSYSVIGNIDPKGFCGSSLIDLLALLLQNGVIDEGGRLNAPCDLEEDVPEALLKRLRENDDENGVFFLTENGPSLQACDVRKLQLAKAAVCAGIRTMEEAAGIAHDAVCSVLISGGFGTHIQKDNLCRIGMIPPTPSEKILSTGNSALSGCEMLLKDPSLFMRLKGLRSRCRYIELSTDPSFTDHFMDEMMFSSDPDESL